MVPKDQTKTNKDMERHHLSKTLRKRGEKRRGMQVRALGLSSGACILVGTAAILTWQGVFGLAYRGTAEVSTLRGAANAAEQQQSTKRTSDDPDSREPIDALEIFEHLRDITDPEHPYSLEQLNVVDEEHITVDDGRGRIRVEFTPTVQHCTLATLIGLCIRVKLLRALPPRFKVDIAVAKGSHSTEAAVNKQLNDKERVAAALENSNLVAMVDKCLAGGKL